ncbi:MAG: NAD(P)-dependent oxidoreductase [Gemmatimonadaceae bacterium]|nr:NAD(P)-dependent oxidoreductase [Gemmatimonadaceae bacterium]
MPGILEQDLDAALARTRDLWTELSGARLLLTGSTGFVGTLLLESVAHARARTGADLRVVALARDPARLRARLPWTGTAAWLDIVRGDTRTFTLPAGTLDLVVHAANTGSPSEITADPDGVARMVVDGSLHVRDIAAAAGARRMLQMSSGSVCGTHFVPAPPIAEDDPGTPGGSDGASRLALAKREAERRMLVSSSAAAPAIMIARGFALCGPWLPLDYSFAFGNFVGAALRNEPIRVTGDGTPVRSFLYASDLVVWLWTILMRGSRGRAYNVGSEHAISIGDLAHRVAARLGGTVQIGETPLPGKPAHWHVPSVARARYELGLEETVLIDDAIVRTATWWAEYRAAVVVRS